MTRRIPQTSLTLFLAVFGLLAVVNLVSLTSPPYWDGIFGLFNQSIWLHRNGFDLVRLWTTEPTYLQGGSNINPYCPLPILYAALYHVLSPAGVFLVLHLLTLALASLTFVLFFRLMSAHVAPAVALLWCLAAACDPIWSGQCASIYREMDLAALGAAAVYCVARGRPRLAWVWVACAFLVKETALILALAILVWTALRRAWGQAAGASGRRPWRTAALLLGLVALVVVAGWRLLPLTGWPAVGRPQDAPGLFATYAFFFFPALALELAVTAGAIAAIALSARRRRLAATDATRAWACVFLVVFIGGFWTAYALFPEPCPRYAVFVVFPMAALLALLLPARAAAVVAASAIAWGCANQYGRFLPTPVAYRQRSGDTLERSREWLVDLEANRRICRTLEQDFFNTPVVAKFPFVQMLTLPELGYVTRPLPHVYAAGVWPRYTPSQPYAPAQPLPPETLFIYAPNAFEHWERFRPRLKPRDGDTLVLSDTSLPGPILIYRRQP